MKRLVAVLAMALTFGVAAQAKALEVVVKGDFHFNFNWQHGGATNANKFGYVEQETFRARERVRTQIEFVASENLKGVLYFNIPHNNGMDWGRSADGGALDANIATARVKYAYIDWKVPSTSLNVKIGLQLLALPAAIGNPVWNDSVAGISLSNKFNDTATLTAGWYRPSNGAAIHDAWDMFVVTVPLSFDGFRLTPWGEYSALGKAVTATDRAGTTLWATGDEYRMYHLGLAAEVTALPNWTFKGDFVYGAADPDDDNFPQTRGFFAALKVSYDLGLGKASGALWYASGDDYDDVTNEGEHGSLPSFINAVDGNPGFGVGVSSLGLWGNNGLAGGGAVSQTGIGTWGLGLMLEDFSFVADLSHTFRALVYQGTNDKEFKAATRVGAGRPGWLTAAPVFMTEKDTAFELNFDHKYTIAKGFVATFDLGAVFMDWQKDVDDTYDDTMWRIACGLYYSF